MQSTAATPEAYIAELPEERKAIISALRQAMIENLPMGFQEVMSYGMLGYVIPHALYPSGYHCDSKQPLTFISIASQKNHIAVYHMGIEACDLTEWLTTRWAELSTLKLDMGKSCIRFKKPEHVPVILFAELAAKVTPQQWIEKYESTIKNKAK
jgi:hypothetical protein